MILKCHRISKNIGYNYSIVLSSETYYHKLVYLVSEKFNIIIPEDISSKNYMVIKLSTHAKLFYGKVSYAKEFGM